MTENVKKKISQKHLILKQRLKRPEVVIKQRQAFDEIQRSLDLQV